MYKLKCNNIKCLASLIHFAYLTSCGHVFCQRCSQHLKSIMKCLACQTLLNTADIRTKDLTHTDSLIGHSPEIIFEESRKSLSFWMYQVYEDLEITKRMYESRLQKSVSEIENLRSQNSRYAMEKEVMVQKIDKLEKDIEREKCSVYEMDCKLAEKSKEMQKLMTLNEKLKFNMRSMEREE